MKKNGEGRALTIPRGKSAGKARLEEGGRSALSEDRGINVLRPRW